MIFFQQRYVGTFAILMLGGMMGLFPLHRSLAESPVSTSVGIEDAVTRVAENVGKAVVSISSERTSRVASRRRVYISSPYGQNGFGYGGHEQLQKFFEDFFGEAPYREFKQVGLGSGVIIDKNGYILTNEHVISGADKIAVTLADGRKFIGEVKGWDKRSDLAVIQINAQDLPSVVLGNSDSLKIGQWVVAIGNPFAFALENPEPTVTVGVISAMHRSLGATPARLSDYTDLIQTDAAINPGNSGGPLVNLKGEVVGINVAIFSTSGGYQGVGFAIPVNTASRIIQRLMQGKKIYYGWLGVIVQNITDDLAAYFSLAENKGVLVSKIMADGPADVAGVKEGDVVMSVDGVAVNNVRELLTIIAKKEIGQETTLAIIRDKKKLTVPVVVGRRPEDNESVSSVDESLDNLKPDGPAQQWRGITVEDIAVSKQKGRVVGETEGVLITRIDADSMAQKAGLVPGDVILEINRQKVSSVSLYKKIAQAIKGTALVKTSRGYFIVKE
ncbi:MAG: Do family serine endopeptidase [Candidatus Omnitrophica bacterium]|nr:Do family serine endopeptidase [Candidatus Omnitrophota bacterium]